MKIKQLQKVLEVNEWQRVMINDMRTLRKIETVEGWVLEPEYEYCGTNVDEVERILNLNVHAAEFKDDLLIIWAH